MRNIVFQHSTETLWTRLTKAAWSGLGVKFLPQLTHPTCSKSQPQTCPGLQTPRSTGLLWWAQLGWGPCLMPSCVLSSSSYGSSHPLSHLWNAFLQVMISPDLALPRGSPETQGLAMQ